MYRMVGGLTLSLRKSIELAPARTEKQDCVYADMRKVADGLAIDTCMLICTYEAVRCKLMGTGRCMCFIKRACLINVRRSGPIGLHTHAGGSRSVHAFISLLDKRTPIGSDRVAYAAVNLPLPFSATLLCCELNRNVTCI